MTDKSTVWLRGRNDWWLVCCSSRRRTCPHLASNKKMCQFINQSSCGRLTNTYVNACDASRAVADTKDSTAIVIQHRKIIHERSQPPLTHWSKWPRNGFFQPAKTMSQNAAESPCVLRGSLQQVPFTCCVLQCGFGLSLHASPAGPCSCRVRRHGAPD